MAARVKQPYAGNGGAHTAGIYADMTSDGPEIGTLVAIIDKAKNLPNRKTIGKQDPYCAARLGKEAKKTKTDVRGGQTPKWDQELRFTVHDSADYYQLKVSVFTDDKRTDLVGEAWVDLKGIVVPGGGQNDLWQTLACRGKYAGEIRVEITYYDTRVHPEKPAVIKSKQPAASEREPVAAKQRTPVKRRPLPSDPVTGEAPGPPSPPVAASPSAASHQDPHQTPPRSHGKQQSHSGFISNQSPLQAVEYSTPPSAPRQPQSDHYSTPPPAAAPPQPYPASSRSDGQYAHQPQRPRDPYDSPSRFQNDRDYGMRQPIPPYEQEVDHRSQYSAPPPEPYDMVSPDDAGAFGAMQMQDDGPPPPPPAHRSRHNSGGTELVSARNSFDLQTQKSMTQMPMRHDVLKNEAHRNSISSYPGQPQFRPTGSAPPAPLPAPAQNQMTYEPPAPRHHSYDAAAYDPHPRALQATVEDAPDSPSGRMRASHRGSGSREFYPDDPGYNGEGRPMPLNLSRSPGASPHYGTPSPMHSPGMYQDQNDYQPSNQVVAAPRGHSTSPGRMPYRAYDERLSGSFQRHESEPPPQMQGSPHRGGGPPGLPASLVPGVDPALSQELSEHIHDRRRDHHYGAASTSTPPRGRQRIEHPAYGHESVSPYATSPGDRSPGYPGGPDPHASQRYSVSPGAAPSVQHTIRRKSVSPAPPVSEDRRLSDIPFGPDSYDSFNPSISPSPDGSRGPVPDPDAKIITHDGREIDPSDHLPMDTWAPEPEPKQGEKRPSPEPRSRPSPSGAQPMPPSGRRPLRVARAPPALPAPPPGPAYARHEEPRTPPGSAGRNRLQKKAHRGSVAQVEPTGSSPLAPRGPDNYQDRHGQHTPTRGPARSSTWDYPSENHAPQYGHGPPVPAKVPLPPMMSGARGGPDDALMEEMQRIDIGAGRSRRRGGY